MDLMCIGPWPALEEQVQTRSAWEKKIKLVAKGWEVKCDELGKNAFICFPFDMSCDLYYAYLKFTLYMARELVFCIASSRWVAI